MPGEWVIWSVVDKWKNTKTGQLIPREFVISVWTNNSEEHMNNFIESHIDGVCIAAIIDATSKQQAVGIISELFQDAADITCDEITTQQQLATILDIFKKKQPRSL